MVRQAHNKSIRKDLQIRTRMAPSPTGEYHIGHIRTLLYNWAFAKKHDGDFIIRIEDTDRERYVEGATDRILDIISAYGFKWDEGPRVGGPYAPYLQSERLKLYQKYSQELVKKGLAYYCFCSQERLDSMRKEQKAKGLVSTKYDRFCLNLAKAEIEKKLKEKTSHVIRMKIPDDKVIKFNDLILGEISVSSNDIDDQILIKSDGFPTYHFAVVVDDHLMKISHIMRGNDWIPSTPKHVLLYQAFGWEIPYFIHIPNLKEMGAGKKLSKRYGAVSAKEFLDEGYLPQAVLNFLMFLGWNPGTEKEIYSLEEFIKDFSIEKIHKTDLVSFDRNKLLWMNGEYIKNMQDSKLKAEIYKFYSRSQENPAFQGGDELSSDMPSSFRGNPALSEWGGCHKGKYEEDKIEKIVPLIKERIKTLKEFETLAGFFFEEPVVDTEILGPRYKDHLKVVYDVLSKAENFSNEIISQLFLKAIGDNHFKTGEFFMDLRIAVSGNKVTPPINESIIILGKDETLKRINKLLT